jgi:hypothetical protein
MPEPPLTLTKEKSIYMDFENLNGLAPMPELHLRGTLGRVSVCWYDKRKQTLHE